MVQIATRSRQLAMMNKFSHFNDYIVCSGLNTVHQINAYFKMPLEKKKAIALRLSERQNSIVVSAVMKKQKNSIMAQHRLLNQSVVMLGKPDKLTIRAFKQKTGKDMLLISAMADRFRVWKGLPDEKSLFEIWNEIGSFDLTDHNFKNLFTLTFHEANISVKYTIQFSYYARNLNNLARLRIDTFNINANIIDNDEIINEEIQAIYKNLYTFLIAFRNAKNWEPQRDFANLRYGGPLMLLYQISNGYTMENPITKELRHFTFAVPASLANVERSFSTQNVLKTFTSFSWDIISEIAKEKVLKINQTSPLIIIESTHKFNIIAQFS